MMKKSRFFLASLSVCLLLVLMPAAAEAAMWDVPVGPGESFRWVFVTSSGRSATSEDIDLYNAFVNGVAANENTTITGVVGFSSIGQIDWKAIASAGTTNARDNIGYSDAGIYTPMGDLVAAGTSDLWDGGPLSHPIDVTEKGDVVGEHYYVWTGTMPDGAGASMTTLGYQWWLPTSVNTHGTAGVSNSQWIYTDNTFNSWAELEFYAISEELTVVPLPSTLILAATGLLSSTLGLKRLRREHQEQRQI